jgi:hypothetical protein
MGARFCGKISLLSGMTGLWPSSFGDSASSRIRGMDGTLRLLPHHRPRRRRPNCLKQNTNWDWIKATFLRNTGRFVLGAGVIPTSSTNFTFLGRVFRSDGKHVATQHRPSSLFLPIRINTPTFILTSVTLIRQNVWRCTRRHETGTGRWSPS